MNNRILPENSVQQRSQKNTRMIIPLQEVRVICCNCIIRSREAEKSIEDDIQSIDRKGNICKIVQMLRNID